MLGEGDAGARYIVASPMSSDSLPGIQSASCFAASFEPCANLVAAQFLFVSETEESTA